jgi:hypothetical protein
LWRRAGNWFSEPGYKAKEIELLSPHSFLFFAFLQTLVSNATRWDTFERMVGEGHMPESEKLFRQVKGSQKPGER